MRSRLTETINNCTAEIAAAAFDTFVGDSAYDTFGIKLTRRRGFPSLVEYTVVGTDIDQQSNIVVGKSERGTIRFQTLPGDRVEVSIEILPTQTSVGSISAVNDTTLQKLFDNAVNHLRSLAAIQSSESSLSVADKYPESAGTYPAGRFVKNVNEGLLMHRLPSELYKHCRATLLKCNEFDDDASLRAMFVTSELRPFRDRSPSAANKSERVDKCLDYLLEQRSGDGRPVLPLFLAALRDRYQEGNALRDELDGLVQEVLTALTSLGVSSKEYRPGTTLPFPSASASPTEPRTENNGDTTLEPTPSVRPDLFPIVVSVIAATVLGLVSNVLANMWRVDTPQRFLITIGVFLLALAAVLWAEFRREHIPIIGLSLLSIRAFAAIGLICFIGGIMVSVVSILTITGPTAPTISPMPAVVASPKSTGTPMLGLTNTPTLTLTSTPLPTNSPVPTFAPIEVPTPEGMIYIQGGQFLMGSSDSQAPSDEHPQDWVIIADFWIDQHEVTNAQYRACVTEGFCRAPHRPDSEGGAPAPMSATRSDYYENPQFDQFPVIFVSWSDAFKYCKWQGKRLPTEAEWEWTAKGQEGFLYPWGNQPPSLSLANYGNENDTQMVGQYGPGALHEIYDMAGNVWEWTSSLYKEYPYRPDDGREDVDAEGKRVLRGGSWRDPSDSLRTTNRDVGTDPDYPLDNVGFRCAKSVE